MIFSLSSPGENSVAAAKSVDLTAYLRATITRLSLALGRVRLQPRVMMKPDGGDLSCTISMLLAKSCSDHEAESGTII